MKENYPKISIVTPVYNQVDYIEETICSIINQQYPNLEYIIIDGGSTDGTLDIIKKYEDKITKWISEPDTGLYNAINKGFKFSTGEIMAWLNADDIYFKDTFNKVAEVFSIFQQVNWLQGIPVCIDKKSRVVSVNNLKYWYKYNYYVKDYAWIQQESVFWRRSLWEKTGSTLSEIYKYAGDIELWTRFFRYENLYSARFTLGAFRLRDNNQLSLDHINDYYKEANTIIDFEVNNVISAQEKSIVKKLRKLRRRQKQRLLVVNFFFKFLYKKALTKYCGNPLIVEFNRETQKFITR